MNRGQVWAVYVNRQLTRDRPEALPHVESIFTSELRATADARQRSLIDGVAAAGVTRYDLDELGTRSRVALYVAGHRQQLPHFTDDHHHIPG